jgi:hypothetical protein
MYPRTVSLVQLRIYLRKFEAERGLIDEKHKDQIFGDIVPLHWDLHSR